MGSRKITIKDIARELGISKSTVSRALQGSRDVSEETSRRVREFADRNDYQPDFMARSLRSKSTRTIGVIVPAYNIPFYSIAICGIQDYAMKQGYNVMVCHSSEQYEVERRNVDALLSANVEGIVISVARNTERNEHIDKLIKRGVPLVMFNRVVEEFRAAKVVVDDYYGARDMVRYLVRTGCRKIGHISGPSNIALSHHRKQGYLDEVKESGLPDEPLLTVETDFTIEGGERGMQMLLAQNSGLDAVFCICDAVAFGAMKVIRSRGMRIPADISVAGFTNEPMSELTEPPLTTVSQPIYEIGESASRLLFSQIGNPGFPAEICVLDTKLVIRESTRTLH